MKRDWKPNSIHKIVNILAEYRSVIIVFLLVVGAEVFGIYVRSFLKVPGSYAEVIVDSFTIFLLLLPFVVFVIYSRNKSLKYRDELFKSQQEYSSTIENIREIILQTDKEGLITFLNPAWEEVTGFSIEESIGKHFMSFIYPDNREESFEGFKNIILGNADSPRLEAKHLTKGGTPVWVEIYIRPVKDNEGNITSIAGTIININKRKEMEFEILRKDRLLEGVAESSNILLSTTDYEQAFEEAIEVIGKVSGADRVHLFKNYDDEETDDKFITELVQWFRKEANIRDRYRARIQDSRYKDIGLFRWYGLLSKGEIINSVIENLPESEIKLIEPLGTLSIMAVPIFVDEKFWGFMVFGDHTLGKVWTRIEETTISIAAASIGGAIKRKQSEEFLNAALKDDFRQTVENLQNIVFRMKRHGNNTFCFTLLEGKLARDIGLTTERVSGKLISEVLPQDLAVQLNDFAERVLKREAFNFEIEVNERVLLINTSLIKENDEIVEIVGYAIDVTEQRKADEKIKYLAYYDALTGLPNRSLFAERLNHAIVHANRNMEMIGVMFLDMDRFKIINDTLGHIVGDRLLEQVAERLKDCVRKDDTISRMGGDEFTIILPDVKGEKHIIKIAQRIMNVFKKPFIVEGHELFITTSIGISVYPYDGYDMESLVKNADISMYRAKEMGRNSYQFYTSSMNEKALERLNLENSLRRALENDEFFLVYQPQVDIETGEVKGVEALIRWENSKLGIVSPMDFIPIAEETGLIIPIGEWVFRTACRQKKAWEDMGLKRIRLSINISAHQFQRENIVRIMEKVLKETKLDPSFLEIEITENCIMENFQRTTNILNKIKAMGISISVDDFGTGFSSLSYLKRFDIDTLKIDRSFIKDLPDNPDDSAITAAIIKMAQSLDLKVIAEGVETHDQMNYLKQNNCQEFQGYLFSKPVFPEEIEIMLKQNKRLE